MEMSDGERLKAIRKEIDRVEYRLTKAMGPKKEKALRAWLEYNRREFEAILNGDQVPVCSGAPN